MKKKNYNNIQKLPFITICIVFFSSFFLPTLAMGVSSFFIFVLLITLVAEKLIPRRFSKIVKIFDNKRNKEDVELAVKVIIIIFLYLAYSGWREKILLLSIPSLVSAVTVLYSLFLGENAVIFLHIISIYIFLKLAVYFLHQTKDNEKIKKFSSFLAILLDIIRIGLICMSVLNLDGVKLIKMPESIIYGVLATVAVDGMLKKISDKASDDSALEIS